MDVSHSHAAGFNTEGGNNVTIDGGRYHDNGQLGITGSGMTNLVVQDARIDRNNNELYSVDWEAGGLKIIGAQSPDFVNNLAENNVGPGLWCDIMCRDAVFDANEAHHNSRAGIMYEISDGATISNNALWENGWGFPNFGWGSGILVSSAKNVDVFGNVLAWNADGLIAIEQNRSETEWKNPGNRMLNVHFHDNLVAATDCGTNCYASAWLDDSNFGTKLYDASRNNRGTSNDYWYGTAEGNAVRFSWLPDYELLAAYNASPGEENGAYVTTEAKNAALTAAGIPLTPEPRARTTG
jgi:hypothetical protein